MRACIRHDVGAMNDSLANRATTSSQDMSNDLNDRTGFDPPIRPQQAARQRTALALIATVALAISIAVAATVVSLGMARANLLGAIENSSGPLAR
jgi:CHASE3 domain sensor protein